MTLIGEDSSGGDLRGDRARRGGSDKSSNASVEHIEIDSVRLAASVRIHRTDVPRHRHATPRPPSALDAKIYRLHSGGEFDQWRFHVAAAGSPVAKSIDVVKDCQYFFGAVLPSVLVLRKADKLARRYQCLDNAFCTYCRSI